MSDLISRADAIRWVKTECNQYGKPTLDYDSGLKVIEHLKKMPSELPSAEARWIPCSEGFPQCGFGLHYLVTLKDGHVFRDDVYEAFFDKYGWHVGDNELACDDIIAWMPLPKPYREENEE